MYQRGISCTRLLHRLRCVFSVGQQTSQPDIQCKQFMPALRERYNFQRTPRRYICRLRKLHLTFHPSAGQIICLALLPF